MTNLLQQAIDAVSHLPAEQQDSIASWLLAELDSENQWADAFSSSQDQLAELARRALDEDARGETEPLELGSG